MLHTLLDAAIMGEEMNTAKSLNDNFRCLYKGDSEKALADFAPYLFTISDQRLFADWILEKGWGKAWGVYIASETSPAEVYRHFRKFLVVRTREGKELYFRFYDPRVLRNFLPTCDSGQLIDFFGPIQYFLAEIDNGTAIRFELRNGKLYQEIINLTEAKQHIR